MMPEARVSSRCHIGTHAPLPNPALMPRTWLSGLGAMLGFWAKGGFLVAELRGAGLGRLGSSSPGVPITPAST